jgi:hypothetical protein
MDPDYFAADFPGKCSIPLMLMKYLLRLALAFGLLSTIPGGSSGVFAQDTMFTYQGCIQDGGTNFTGAGLFQFALVTSSNANQTATAVATNPVSTFITTINVTFGGSGYVTAPAVTIFGGGGSNATATATISTNGVVTAITINPGGNGYGYTNTPTVTIAPPPPDITYVTYWSNDGTSSAGGEPSAEVSVGVTNGLFTVVLGNTAIPNMAAINAALFNQPNLQLLIWFNDGVKGFAVLSPAQNLTPAPYSVFAGSASNLLGNLPATQLSGALASSVLPVSPEFSGTVSAESFSGSGTNLTSLDASSLTSGTVPLAQLSGITSNQLDAATWALATNLNGGNAALASNLVSGVIITNAVVTNSIFAGNGGGLTNLNAAQLTSIGNTNIDVAGNFFIGPAGNATMIGVNNTALGGNALVANTNGTDNTAIGLNALNQNTGGNNNTASGAYALQDNTNGNNNTAYGLRTLYTNTSGSYNTANGSYALYANISGNNNTALGVNALVNNTNGSGNIAVGFGALGTNASGSYNIALGYGAGGLIIGSSNIDIGNVGTATDIDIVRIGSSQTETFLSGAVYAGTVALTSDRNAKDAFDAINPQAVLARVSALPITEWQYKTDTEGSRHIGPMAQDFHAAFGLNGGDDRHISVVDEGGVALAAIQGLNQKVEVEDRRLAAENADLKRQNDLLEKRLERLEQLINTNNDAAK